MESRFGHDGEQSGSRLELLLEASGVIGTWEWDHVHHTVTYDNGGALYLTGDWSNAGRPLKGHEAMKTVHRDDYEKMIERSVKATKNGSIIVSEYRVEVPGKGLRRVLSRGKTYHDAKGKAVRSHGMLIDITETHDDVSTYVVGAPIEADDPFRTVVDHLIAAREFYESEGQHQINKILDIVLMETGKLIARQIQSVKNKQH
ncbi:hypothetical protein [Methylobacterium cerastii]|uniref:hypothetical protein n=1 Tax=Methylobacterium cerastii TaxID=932741 RepID=UPI001EE2E67C|nr:hypothetical protein [Methylobacterium cerastii]